MPADLFNVADLEPESRLALTSGKVVVVVDNPRDGTWLVCRDQAGADGDSEEYLVASSEIAGLA